MSDKNNDNSSDKDKNVFTDETVLFISPRDTLCMTKKDLGIAKKEMVNYKSDVVEELPGVVIGLTVPVKSDLDCMKIVNHLSGKLSSDYLASLITGRECHSRKEIFCYRNIGKNINYK